MTSWRIFGEASKAEVEAALDRQAEHEDWPADFVVAGHEIAADRPDDWIAEAWLPRRPRKADIVALQELFGGRAPHFSTEQLADEDWVTLSQQGVDPIRAGRFRVRTPEHDPLGDSTVREFVIPASQAFGTGQHATTAGCLAMLDSMRRRGVQVRHLADIGTGTGLLAFVAMDLWPQARATASDIDPVCEPVIAENMALNGVHAGPAPGRLAIAIADGMNAPMLARRAPFDLLIANILAAPLIDLAPEFADATAPGGSLVLAGLLETQEAAVRRAYRREGFRLAARIVRGDWSILWLRLRHLR